MNILRFHPLLKETLWGGERIVPFKHLDGITAQGIGESWELSGFPGNETVVADGPYEGRKINEVVAELKERLVGHDNYRRFGNEFPLLIKFIDARKDLSIQVHPDDEMAVQHGLERGKTEMWYFLEGDPEARILTGLKQQLTAERYKEMVADDTICDAIADYKVQEGDVFYLPAGRIHSIGAGCFLAEVQQTCDTTYRIYDFKRKDKHGNYRELHTQLAAEAIDYTVCDDYQTHYEDRKNERIELVKAPCFTVALYDLMTEESNTESSVSSKENTSSINNGNGNSNGDDTLGSSSTDTDVKVHKPAVSSRKPFTLDYSSFDSFVILICVKGEGTLTDAHGESRSFAMGDVLLIPATETTFTVTGNVKFLEAYP